MSRRLPLSANAAIFVAPVLLLLAACAAPPPPTAVNPASVPGTPAPARSRTAADRPPADAALSPDRLRAAWVKDGNSIVSATRAAPDAAWSAPNRLLTTRGIVHKLVFSPDGKSIAYENQRSWKDDGTPNDTWQFICVYDIAGRRISYVDPSFDMDSDPQWTADGQVAFTRKVAGLADARLVRPVSRLQLGDYAPPPKRPSEIFTMASIIAAPFIYPPTVSADGKALAYITREAKVRNVYYLRVGQEAKRIASYPGDEGQDMSDAPAISRTGAAVAYVHGGRINRQGDAPNPNSVPDMPQQQVWIVGTGDDAPRLLGPGKDPMFLPDDSRILWRADGKVMAAALSWKDGRLFGVGNPEEFLSGMRQDLAFSPDGSKAAYSHGGNVEIYDFASQVAVAVPHAKGMVDAGPVWSPDGTQLAYREESAASPGLRGNSCGHGRYCGPLEADPPWSIWIADASGLSPRKIWQAHAGRGSVFYPFDQSLSPGQHGEQLLWTAGGRIAFAWEGDGWRHLYAVPASGGDAVLLTPGDGEVETAALSPDRKRIVYATNIGELGRRHIWSVGLDGAAPRAETGGEADQWSPAPLADGGLAYVTAGFATPPKVAVKSADGKIALARFPGVPADFPAALLVKPQLVDFPASDGRTTHGQLFVPRKPEGCAVIFSHGGMRRQMLPGFHYMDAYQYLYEMNQYLASRGCVVLSVDYRSGIMYGEDYRNAPGFGYAGNSELLDFVGAAKFLAARKDVDASRGIGIYGLSWGGYMTSELLAQHSDLFSVGFDMAGVHYAGDPEGEKYSAIGHLDSWTSPVFLAQGDDDMNVDFNQGTTLARALQARRPNVEFRQQVLPGQTHDLYLTYEQLVTIYDEGSQWLIGHLGAK